MDTCETSGLSGRDDEEKESEQDHQQPAGRLQLRHAFAFFFFHLSTLQECACVSGHWLEVAARLNSCDDRRGHGVRVRLSAPPSCVFGESTANHGALEKTRGEKKEVVF
jgi:hypothetical protein